MPRLPMSLEKIRGQFLDVGPALAQRRHANVDAAEPIIQIGPKQLALDQIPQAAIGRGDDPDVDAVGAIAADALDRRS